MTTEPAPRLSHGRTPLLISIPHAGEQVPAHIRDRLTPDARGLPDTDWHVDRLYGWAGEAGAGLLVATASRYVVDLNRPPDDAPLYDRHTTRLVTGVVPSQDFDGNPLYRAGAEPDEHEVELRIGEYWQPYHALLRGELDRIRGRHGHAVLLDAHSIRHQVPLLFEGSLPDLNLGTNGGLSATPALVAGAAQSLEGNGFALIVNGRFKGGYITRHYGCPEAGVHALQLELAQRAYMDEASGRWDEARAQPLQRVLMALVAALTEWRPNDD